MADKKNLQKKFLVEWVCVLVTILACIFHLNLELFNESLQISYCLKVIVHDTLTFFQVTIVQTHCIYTLLELSCQTIKSRNLL